jgi:putative copper export protein
MPPFVTYALLGLCAAGFAFGLWLESEKRNGTRFERWRRLSWVLQVAMVVAVYFVLRPGRGTHDPQGSLAAAQQAGTPVFLDFYSNY